MRSKYQSTQANCVQTGQACCQVARTVQRLSPGLLRLDQEVCATGHERGLDATGRFWMLAAIEVRHGAVEYVSGGQRVPAPAKVFGVSAPPFSILEVALSRTNSHSMAFVSTEKASPTLPGEPVAFDIASPDVPDSVPDLIQEFSERSSTIRIGRCQRPPPLALRTKAAIDETYALQIPLSAIAAELGTSASAMSRAFNGSYGIPPVRYRHLVRIMDGMMRLLEGEPVTRVFQDVGFEDLSRFYRQFKRYTLSPPSVYRF